MTQIITRSGTVVDLLNPKPDDIHIDDIAWSLSRMSRYLGHTLGIPYNVAQHSVLVAEIVTEKQAAAVALMHDAHEAYLGDIVGPLKDHLIGYEGVAANMQHVIHRRFGLPWPVPPLWQEDVQDADRELCAVELRDIMPRPNMPIGPANYPIPVTKLAISTVHTEREAYDAFIREYRTLWQRGLIRT